MVCIPFPEKTITDQLLHTDVVVLARENPEKPFSYIAKRVLKGDLDDSAIDFFVNSPTRRRLALNPDQSVVLTFNTETSQWQYAGYATHAYSALVDEILARAPLWIKLGADSAKSRATFFAPYLADADPAVSKLAYLEVGQASYDSIRQANAFVSTEQIYRFLDNSQYIEWHALYILLLGVEANPAEQEVIRTTMMRLAKYDQKLNLSAWATALIEIDGEEAIHRLEADYLGKPGRDPDTVVEVVKALSVHGSRERPRLRRRIAESYELLVQTYPSLAGWAARDLTAWADWRFAETLAELRNSQAEIDGATAFAIDYYVGRSQSGIPN